MSKRFLLAVSFLLICAFTLSMANNATTQPKQFQPSQEKQEKGNGNIMKGVEPAKPTNPIKTTKSEKPEIPLPSSPTKPKPPVVPNVPNFYPAMVDQPGNNNPPQPFANGGPDNDGYIWIDMNSPGGPTYSWDDNASPAGSNYGDDTYFGPFNLGFTFTYRGSNYTQVYVSCNGYFKFTSGSDGYGTYYPNSGNGSTTNGVYHGDLQSNGTGSPVSQVKWGAYGTDPNMRYVITWDSVYNYGSPTGNRYTFQAILYQTSNEIVYQYKKSTGGWQASTRYVGNQNSGSPAWYGLPGLTGGQTVNTIYSNITNGYAVKLSLPPPLSNDMQTMSVDNVPPFIQGGAIQTIQATVRNLGTTTQNPGVPVGLEITGPGGYSYTDNDQATLTTLAQNATEQITFSPDWTVPSVKGVYTIKVWTALSGDENTANDTFTTTREVYNGFYEPFTTTTFPPPGWTVYNFNAGNAWLRQTSYYNSAPAAAMCWYDMQNNDWLITPRVGPVASGDSVIFFYRAYSTWYYEPMDVRVSTSSNFADTSQYTTIGTVNTISTAWQRAAFDLSPYTGQNIYIAFYYYGTYAYGIILDDVFGPPFYIVYDDMQTVSIDNMPDMIPAGAHTLQATVKSNGINTVSPGVPVKLHIDGPGGYTYDDNDQTTLTTLTQYGTEQITFSPDWDAPTTPGFYTIKVWTELAGDQDLSNDTLTFVTRVWNGMYEPFSNGVPPEGWQVWDFNGGNPWTWATFNYRSAPGCAEAFYDYITTPNNDWLVSLRLGPVASGDSVIFYYRSYYTYNWQYLNVRVSTATDPSDTSQYTIIGTVSSLSETYQRAAFDLSSYAGEKIYIAFHYYDNYAYYGMFIDDVYGPPIYIPAADVKTTNAYETTYPLAINDALPDTIEGWVKNIGTGAVGSFDVYLAENGTDVASVNVAGLNSGESTLVRIPYSPTVEERKYLTLHSALVGDENPGNDGFTFNDYAFEAGTYAAEGFDPPYTTSFPPAGWVAIDNDGGGEPCNWGWYTGAGYEHAGVDFAMCMYEWSGWPNDDWLVTSAITPSAADFDTFGIFYRAMYNWSPEAMEIWVMTGQSVGEAVEMLWQDAAITNETYNRLALSLDAYDGQTIYIGIRYNANYMYYLLVDDAWFSKTLVNPILSPAPPTLNFGDVLVGTSKVDSVLVTNTGNAQLDISSVVSDNAQFTVFPTDGVLPIMEQMWFYITYLPTAAGAVSANIEFTHNGPASPDTVVVTGNGVAAGFLVTPATINYGNVIIGTTKKDSVEVTNTGTYQLNIASVASDNPLFTVTPGSGSLIPSAKMKFFITFAPTGVGAQAGNIVFTHDATTSPDTVTVSGSGFVPATAWLTMSNIKPEPSGKNPKSGSSLAGLNGEVYFLKASNRPDFAKFTPNATTGTWTVIDSFGKGDKAAGDGKYAKKGASMAAYDDAKLFVLRGNNTPGFWKYVVTPGVGETLGWKKMANITTGAKNPKDASGMVAITRTTPAGDSDYLFVMKGSKTEEFYFYNIEANTWLPAIQAPPAGLSGKTGFKKGSCVAYDAVNKNVYVLRGQYGDFYKFNVDSLAWKQLRRYDAKTMPNRDGKKKKIGEGSGLVYYNDALYLLKGGNTFEMWKYQLVPDSGWSQLNPMAQWDIPTGGGKKVKGGGGMTMLSGGLYAGLYASKGANTAEFYYHGLPTFDAVLLNPSLPTDNEGAMGKSLTTNGFKLTLAPNPANNLTTIRYSLPVAGPVNYKLYDVTGKVVRTYANTNPNKDGALSIDTKTLPSGVYMLRFNAGTINTTRKLVLEK